MKETDGYHKQYIKCLAISTRVIELKQQFS